MPWVDWASGVFRKVFSRPSQLGSLVSRVTPKLRHMSRLQKIEALAEMDECLYDGDDDDDPQAGWLRYYLSYRSGTAQVYPQYDDYLTAAETTTFVLRLVAWVDALQAYGVCLASYSADPRGWLDLGIRKHGEMALLDLEVEGSDPITWYPPPLRLVIDASAAGVAAYLDRQMCDLLLGIIARLPPDHPLVLVDLEFLMMMVKALESMIQLETPLRSEANTEAWLRDNIYDAYPRYPGCLPKAVGYSSPPTFLCAFIASSIKA